MNAKLTTITPAIAKTLLSSNIKNRTLNSKHVDSLAKEIKAGRWKINGDMIRIGLSGRILDGQHRLNAIVKSEMTIQTWVMDGLSDDIFDTIDVGKRRSGGDTLSCKGEKNACRLVAALIMVDKYMTGRVESGGQYSNGEIEELLEKYPDIRNSIHVSGKGRTLTMPSVMDACHYLFSQKDPIDANLFISRLIRGTGLEENDPEFVLREKLVSNSLAKAKLNKAHIFALFIKAWNHCRNGIKIQRMNLIVRDGKIVDFPSIQ